MRTHGHREGSITYWGRLRVVGARGGTLQGQGGWEGKMLGAMPDVGNSGT